MDYRDRCTQGHLTCAKCGCCNGCGDQQAPNWTGSYPSGVNGLGKITTDRHGRTLHAECRDDQRLEA